MVKIREKKFLNEILRLNQTVFSFKELILILKTDDAKSVKSKLSYYLKNGDLYHIRRGLYSKDSNYNRFELATRILTPSYISFETVLTSAGIVFQYYGQIFVASYQSRIISCDEQEYVFRTIKPAILTNSLGVEMSSGYSIATPERAFLDVVYINKDYYFDNLYPLDWDKVYSFLTIYDDIRNMKSKVDSYYKTYKNSQSVDLNNLKKKK